MMQGVRKAIPEDAEHISRVRITAWKEWYQWLIDQSYLDGLVTGQEDVEKIKNRIIEKKENYLVYEEAGTVLWFIRGGICRDENTDYWSEIYAFYVDPSEQKKWIGSKLFEAFLEQTGNVAVCLRTLPWSKGDSFYKKMWGIMDGEREEEMIGGKPYKEIRYSRKRKIKK